MGCPLYPPCPRKKTQIYTKRIIERIKAKAERKTVIVIGVLGHGPETKQIPNGGSVTTFSIAITEKGKEKTAGEHKEAIESVLTPT